MPHRHYPIRVVTPDGGFEYSVVLTVGAFPELVEEESKPDSARAFERFH